MVGYRNYFFIINEFNGLSISVFFSFPFIWFFVLGAGEEAEYKLLPGGSNDDPEKKGTDSSEPEVTHLRS